MSEAQGTELIEGVAALKEAVEGLWKATNSLALAILAALLVIAFFSAMRAVRRA